MTGGATVGKHVMRKQAEQAEQAKESQPEGGASKSEPETNDEKLKKYYPVGI